MNKQQKEEFYKKMAEAKKRKKEALEAAQLRAEFEANPQAFQPSPKTEAEQKMDMALTELRLKLRSEHLAKQAKLDDAFMNIEKKLEGL